jgi:hypothetical protein
MSIYKVTDLYLWKISHRKNQKYNKLLLGIEDKLVMKKKKFGRETRQAMQRRCLKKYREIEAARKGNAEQQELQQRIRFYEWELNKLANPKYSLRDRQEQAMRLRLRQDKRKDGNSHMDVISKLICGTARE